MSKKLITLNDYKLDSSSVYQSPEMIKSSGGSNSNYYTKLAEYTLSGSYIDFTELVCFQTTLQNANISSLLVSIDIRKGKTDIFTNIRKMAGKLTNVEFYFVYNYDSDTDAASCTLYSYTKANNIKLYGKVLLSNNNITQSSQSINKEYFQNQDRLTSLPDGTVTKETDSYKRIDNYDSTTTQTLKNVNGTLKWVTDE